MENKNHPGWIKRNQHLKKCQKLNVSLYLTRNRAIKRKDCPVWLSTQLSNAIDISDSLIEPLELHRDHLPEFIKATK